MAKALEGRAQLVASQRAASRWASDDNSQLVIIQPPRQLLSVVGVRAALGRASLGEAAGRPETVLGYGCGKRVFRATRTSSARPFAQSQSILVAGVMPEAFTGLARGLLTASG